MSILFLDIDGVLNSTSYWRDNGPLPMGKAGALDPEAIARLNTIICETGCRVVLSSSWRGPQLRLRSVGVMLRERGFLFHLHDGTPWHDHGCERHCEITSWMTLNREEGERFMVLDDDTDAFRPDFAPLGCFVNTNYLVGLQDDGVEMAICHLRAS